MLLGKIISLESDSSNKRIHDIWLKLSPTLEIDHDSLKDSKMTVLQPYKHDGGEYIRHYLGVPQVVSPRNRVVWLVGYGFRKARKDGMEYVSKVFEIGEVPFLHYFLWIDKECRVFMEFIPLGDDTDVDRLEDDLMEGGNVPW